MAADTALLGLAEDRQLTTLRFYGWTEKAVSIGYFQPAAQVVPDGYVFVRRPTGGGVVYHDIDLTFSLATPKAHPLCQVDRFTSYRLINEAVRQAAADLGYEAWLTDTGSELENRASLVCFQSPAKYDVMVGNRKLCGGAQRRTAGGLLLQSSLDPRSLEHHDRQAVTEALIQRLLPLLAERQEVFRGDDDFHQRVRHWRGARYQTDAWNHKR